MALTENQEKFNALLEMVKSDVRNALVHAVSAVISGDEALGHIYADFVVAIYRHYGIDVLGE